MTSLEQLIRSVSNVVDDTPELIALLQRTIVYDPLQRLDVTDILEHPWFVGPPHPAPLSERIPPPSLFTAGKPKPTDTNQEDLPATLIATSPGLPISKLEPPPLLLESSVTTGKDTTTVSLVTRPSPPSIATPFV